jgi:hypothetical protein
MRGRDGQEKSRGTLASFTFLNGIETTTKSTFPISPLLLFALIRKRIWFLVSREKSKGGEGKKKKSTHPIINK